MNQFCPYCRKNTGVFLSGSKRIKIDPNSKEIIVENYSCETCGYFLFSKQEEPIISTMNISMKMRI